MDEDEDPTGTYDSMSLEEGLRELGNRVTELRDKMQDVNAAVDRFLAHQHTFLMLNLTDLEGRLKTLEAEVRELKAGR